MVVDAETVWGAASPLRINRAAWAAASPPDTRLCMRRILASSAALYSRKPPVVSVGWRSPYRCSQARSSSGLTPVRLASSPIRRKPDPGSDVAWWRSCSFTHVLYKQSTITVQTLDKGVAVAAFSVQKLDKSSTEGGSP